MVRGSLPCCESSPARRGDAPMAPVCKGARIPNYKRHNGSWRWTRCAFIDSSHSKEGRIWSTAYFTSNGAPDWIGWTLKNAYVLSVGNNLTAKISHKLKASNPTMRIHENTQWSQPLVLIAGMKQATVKKHNGANGAVDELKVDLLTLRRFLEAPESVCPMEKGTFFETTIYSYILDMPNQGTHLWGNLNREINMEQ